MAAAGPCHDPPVSPDVTDENAAAAVLNSSANPSQAAAAASIGPDPVPANIRSELISGGNTEKFITVVLVPVPSQRRGQLLVFTVALFESVILMTDLAACCRL